MENKGALLLELDEQSWEKFCDNAKKWLDNTLMAQSAFRQMAEDTKNKITEPHLRKYISDIHERAVKHEEQIEELYKFVDRDSSNVRSILGTILGKSQKAFAQVLAIGGGATGPWQHLHELFLSNLNSIGAFGVVEQIGLALAIPEMADLAFNIVAEKNTDQLMLQEIVLEMSVPAILYNTSF